MIFRSLVPRTARRAFVVAAALVAAVTALALLGPAASPPALAQDGPDATVRPDRLYMRHGPGSQYAIIAELTRGTGLTLTGQNGPWVYCLASDGNEGWLASGYIDLRADFNLDVVPFREAPADLGTPIDLSPASPAADASQPDAGQPESGTDPQAGAPAGDGFSAEITATINMRSGPGTDYKVLGSVEYGTTVQATGRNDAMDWVFINASGREGWVFWDYIRLNGGYISSLPVTDVIVSQAAPAAPAPSDENGDDSSAAVAVPAPVASGPGLAGFGYGGHVDSFAHSDKMAYAGMTWAKRQLRFQWGAPGSVAAGAINEAHAKGFKILLGIVGNPADINKPGYFEEYARFVGEVAALGPDAIEVWNEQNIDREWPTGHIDPALYTQLLAQAYNAIKSANANVAVISGAPAPTGAEGAFGSDRVWNDNRYVSGMAAAGAASYMDCIGAHYNEGIISPNQTSGDPRDEYFTRYFWGMVNTYYTAFGGARPICFTELGYLSPEGFGPLPGAYGWGADTSVSEQAQWLAQAVQLSRGSGKVRLVIIWNVDFTQYGADPMAGYAIVRPGGACPACDALAGVR